MTLINLIISALVGALFGFGAGLSATRMIVQDEDDLIDRAAAEAERRIRRSAQERPL
ncbi:hypothetical protein KUV64_13965 [Mameliella alba]|uniref:hypothetical protein n=1 Tax=Mameliella TaxID=1434019 RepID=UPI001C93F06E|nr:MULTISPECIES: hypothetical protein [Mameliella]MBY6120239.1 hypothetical protein [Mameliella alba]MDD9733126.1 hypothetical protein [Mameliella sp. AT18]